MECQVGDLLVDWKTQSPAVVTNVEWWNLAESLTTFITVWYPLEKRAATYESDYIAEKLRKVTDGATFQSR